MSLWIRKTERTGRRSLYLLDVPWELAFLLVGITIVLLVVVSFPVGATNAHGVSQKVRRGISGRITDPNGALVVGAKITIVGRSSHTTVVKKSNVKGQYVADLDPTRTTLSLRRLGSKLPHGNQFPCRVSRAATSISFFTLEKLAARN